MQELKRLLSPLSFVRGKIVFLVLRGIRWWVSWAMSALAMKYIINALELKNRSTTLYWVGIMSVVLLISAGFSYPTRIISNTVFRTMQKKIYQQYLLKFFNADNNVIDKFGTWQINNIIQKGIDNWISLIQRIPQNGTEIILSIIVAIITIFLQVWWQWTMIVATVMLLSFWINQKWNKGVASIRKERREYTTLADKNIVRMIMSKTEIVQNNKQNYENNILTSFFEKILILQNKEEKMRVLSFDLQRVFFAVLQIILLLRVGWWVYNGSYSLGTLGLVWMLTNQINGRIMDLNDFNYSISSGHSICS